MARNRIRGLLGVKSNDGHDAPLLVVAELLKEAGVEVIYAGYDLTAEQFARAAIEEGVHFVGVSSYNGGHIPFFKSVHDRLKASGYPFPHMIGGGGATITPEDAQILEAHGIDHIFRQQEGPLAGAYIDEHFDFLALPDRWEDHLAAARKGASVSLGLLINAAEEAARLEALLTAERDRQGIRAWAEGSTPQVRTRSIEGDGRTVGEIIAAIEGLRIALDSFRGSEGNGRVVGFTGRGGSGKSTLIDQMVRRWFEDPAHAGRRLALLAVDPSSERSGGAILADRVSYAYATNKRWVDVDRLFIRSLASRGAPGGISRALPDAIRVLKACGFDVICETYGTGQPDTAIAPLVDRPVFVTTPDFGAAAQLRKEGMLEIPEALVVLNKSDLSGGPSASALLRDRVDVDRLHFTNAVEHGDPGLAGLYASLWGRP